MPHQSPFPGPWEDFPVTDQERAWIARIKGRPITFTITRDGQTKSGIGELIINLVGGKAQAGIHRDRRPLVSREFINLSKGDFDAIQEPPGGLVLKMGPWT